MYIQSFLPCHAAELGPRLAKDVFASLFDGHICDLAIE